MSYVNTYYLNKTSDNGLELYSEEHKHSILPITYADSFIVDMVNSLVKKRNVNKYKSMFPDLSDSIMVSSFIHHIWNLVDSSGLKNNMDEFYCRFGYGVYGCSKPGVYLMLVVNTKGRI